MSNHVLCNDYWYVVLAIVNLESQAHEVGQDGRRAGLCADGRDLVSGLLGEDNR